MRLSSKMLALAHRPAPWTSALVAMATLCLAACMSDSPTGVGSTGASDGPITSLAIPPGGAAGAVGSQGRFRVMPNIAHMNSAPATLSPSGATTNSPWNLTYFGGPTLTSATSWNVYVNCPAGAARCWGTGTLTPATYLNDLNVSSLILVADQYLHENASNQWSVEQLAATYKFADHTAQDSDIFNILYAVTRYTHSTGYHNIYHVFLPQGTDMCIDSATCYSPDNPSTFVFCAFHSNVDFGSQHVLYTVEPYQAVSGCPLPTQTRVIDATASTLSHEFFETITDPDLDAWFNALDGNEVSDICYGFRFPTFVGHRTYTVQEEYSNDIQDCTNGAY